MAARTVTPGTTDPGDVWTSAFVDSLPGGWLGVAEVVANQTTITAETDLTDLLVNVTVNESRLLRLSVQGIFTRTVADGVTVLRIKEGTTTLQTVQIEPPTTAGVSAAGFVFLDAPSAGAHTYKATLERLTGTGSVGLTASATAPANLIVEDLGPAVV